MSTKLPPAVIAAAYEASCLAELDALKPGNVHAFAAGHRMAVADFAASARVSAPHLAREGAGLGARILGGVEATMAAVGQNTNLGILLLCAPLSLAAERGVPVSAILDTLDARDAADVFSAIRRANPGGLGEATRHDVNGAAPSSLRAAMAEAAPRDRIACAYVTGFEDVFAIGLPALAAARGLGLTPPWTTTAVFLAYLAAFPDSHVARKHGPGRAEEIRSEARTLLHLDLRTAPVADLLARDARWKADGINPGTSADFTVATLFLDALGTAPVGGSDRLIELPSS